MFVQYKRIHFFFSFSEQTMMHPAALATLFLGMLLAHQIEAGLTSFEMDLNSAVCPDLHPIITNVVYTSNEHALWQSNVTSVYMAFWYFSHEGSCDEAEEPVVSLKCTNGGNLTVLAGSNQVAYCAKTDGYASEATCGTEARKSSGHAVKFSCSAETVQETTAQATVLEQNETCVGGGWGKLPGTDWGNGILLSLECKDDVDISNQTVVHINGTCTPSFTGLPNHSCKSEYSCKNGNCQDGIHSIPDTTSAITNADCGIYSSFSSSPIWSPMAVNLTTASFKLRGSSLSH
jgi:hypothetical protein